jgi:hypothetical protein
MSGPLRPEYMDQIRSRSVSARFRGFMKIQEAANTECTEGEILCIVLQFQLQACSILELKESSRY